MLFFLFCKYIFKSYCVFNKYANTAKGSAVFVSCFMHLNQELAYPGVELVHINSVNRGSTAIIKNNDKTQKTNGSRSKESSL